MQAASYVLETLLGGNAFEVDDTAGDEFARRYVRSDGYEALKATDEVFEQLALLLASRNFEAADELAFNHGFTELEWESLPADPAPDSVISRLVLHFTFECKDALQDVQEYSAYLSEFDPEPTIQEAFASGENYASGARLGSDVDQCRAGIVLLEHLLQPFETAAADVSAPPLTSR